MNRAILIILIPALLVAAGYIFVLRWMGLAPSYARLALPVVVLVGAVYLFSRRGRRGANPESK